MPRTILEEARLHPAIRETVANLNADIVHNVQAAAASNPVLVVGMAGNPLVRKARKLLEAPPASPITTSSTAATSAAGAGATR